MAARDPDHPSSLRAARAPEPPLAAEALAARLDEEIGRAERYGTTLSCLLVVIDNLEEMTREHGPGLAGQTVAYIAEALGRELRRFDRVGRPGDGELLVVLPGTDGPLGEVVARRLLERIQTIKVESRGTRQPLEISVGLAAWHAQMSGADLLARVRIAAQRQNGEEDPLARPEAPAALAPPGFESDPSRPFEPPGPPIGPG